MVNSSRRSCTTRQVTTRNTALPAVSNNGPERPITPATSVNAPAPVSSGAR